LLCCASSLCLRVASLCRRSCVTWSCSFVSQLRRLQMDFGEIFCAGRASEKEKLLRAIPKRLFTDVGLSWRTFAYGEILCIWTRNNQCRALLPCRPREIFLGPTLLALTYGLDKFRHWIYGRKIFFQSFAAITSSASSPAAAWPEPRQLEQRCCERYRTRGVCRIWIVMNVVLLVLAFPVTEVLNVQVVTSNCFIMH